MRHVKVNRVVVRGGMIHARVAMVLSGKDVASGPRAGRGPAPVVFEPLSSIDGPVEALRMTFRGRTQTGKRVD